MNIPGIHHVTAIASDPQRNVDFYAGVLGLRLVKRTVNFDDPGAYHLYYGDSLGRPGTILTFFAWPGALRGRLGAGQVTVTSFSVPEQALPYWTERFREHGIRVEEPIVRLDEQVLSFQDPDGLQLELVASRQTQPGYVTSAWKDSPVPAEYAIRGFHGVTLAEIDYEATTDLLSEAFGFGPAGQVGDRTRYQSSSGQPGSIVDLVRPVPAPLRGRVAVGTVHHVAWRAASDEEQLAWRDLLLGRGLSVTPVLDRMYFHSIYFREPGGVLFEIATDPPGFAVDETPEQLGTGLKLPPWLEPARAELEQQLPPIRLPQRVLSPDSATD